MRWGMRSELLANAQSSAPLEASAHHPVGCVAKAGCKPVWNIVHGLAVSCAHRPVTADTPLQSLRKTTWLREGTPSARDQLQGQRSALRSVCRLLCTTGVPANKRPDRGYRLKLLRKGCQLRLRAIHATGHAFSALSLVRALLGARWVGERRQDLPQARRPLTGIIDTVGGRRNEGELGPGGGVIG